MPFFDTGPSRNKKLAIQLRIITETEGIARLRKFRV